MVDRVVRIIPAFPEGVNALQLSDLAERADLPLTTAHRLVRQLAGHGLLETGSGGSVRLGLRLWELVNRKSPTLALRQAAMPFMEDIQQVLNQNVNLAVLDGWEALFVERLSRRGSVANRAQMAGRMPVHVSSAGLALMAHQPRAVPGGVPAAVPRSRREGAADELRTLLAEAPHQGYAQLEAWWIRAPGGSRCPCWTRETGGGCARRRRSPAGDAPPGTGAGTADGRPGNRARGCREPEHGWIPFNGIRCNARHVPGRTL